MVVHDKKAYVAVERNIWEVASAGIVYDSQEFVHEYAEAEYVGNGVIIELLNEMWGWAGGAVVSIIVGLQLVEARHGMVFHPLWPWENWVSLGGGHGLGSASIPNPLAWLLHMSL